MPDPALSEIRGSISLHNRNGSICQLSSIYSGIRGKHTQKGYIVTYSTLCNVFEVKLM